MNNIELALDVGELPIFFISDVHSNLPALESVLNQIPDSAHVVCAGDLLGYYTEPNQVCELLRQRNVHCIKGNHDKYVLRELEYAPSREVKYRIQPTMVQLNRENTEWVAALPDSLKIVIQPIEGVACIGCIHVAHGSPASVEEYIYKDTPVTFRWPEGADYLVLGHTHHPFKRPIPEGVIVNPGSVGQVRDRIPGASYASVNAMTGEISFFRADYDVAAYQLKLRQAGVDETMINILSRVA